VYGARFYDPSVGRFTSIDPLAEVNFHQSGFAYADNNPIRFIDFMGLSAENPDWIDNGDGTYTAEDGDSAYSLAKDAYISLEEADKIVQDQYGANYVGVDGEMKSNVDPGDVVDVCCTEKTQIEQDKLDNISAANSNYSKIKSNEKTSDSLTGVRNKLQNDLKLSQAINETMPTFPDEPRGGIGLGVALKNTIKELKIRKLDTSIIKLKRTNDSLKLVNDKLLPHTYTLIKG